MTDAAERLRARADKARAELEASEAKLAELAARERAEQDERERRFDEEFVASFDRAALEREKQEAYERVEATILEEPWVQALLEYHYRSARESAQIAELQGALYRLGRDAEAEMIRLPSIRELDPRDAVAHAIAVETSRRLGDDAADFWEARDANTAR